ncbi:MAG: RNA-binding cell elongation regulator Jag/EloR [Dehalococcoidales bacterium]|jgi:spoIIIJ-associated protein|nr:RNA-binding cell elongation regulator Jag/EloR [Dehalococcoidales bacterium]
MEMEFSAKTVEEAIQRALEQLGVSREEVDVTVVEEGKPGILGLGSEPAMVRVTPLTAVPQDDATEITKAVLEKLLVLMGVEGSITSQVETVTEGTPSVTVNIHGDDLGILIGRRGQTLSSLQYLVRLMVNLQTKSRAPIIVDIEDYKQRRYRVLEDFARQIAEQVKAQDRSFTFEPMSSFERRIIHITLADYPGVTTKSVGSGKERQVIVLPKKV